MILLHVELTGPRTIHMHTAHFKRGDPQLARDFARSFLEARAFDAER
jgi:hypothetical protein